MKTTRTRPLTLRKETLRSISSRDLARVAAAGLGVVDALQAPEPQGFIMKDSIIVPTSGRR